MTQPPEPVVSVGLAAIGWIKDQVGWPAAEVVRAACRWRIIEVQAGAHVTIAATRRPPPNPRLRLRSCRCGLASAGQYQRVGPALRCGYKLPGDSWQGCGWVRRRERKRKR